MAHLRDLRFDLPARFRDLTECFFESKQGPIFKLPLSFLPLAAPEVDPWLLKTRDDLGVFPRARRGALQTFDNPRFLVRGFEAHFGSSSVIVALLVFDEGALLLQPKIQPGSGRSARFLMRTLDLDDAPQLLPFEPAAQRYRALGFRFDSRQSFERPPYLTLQGPDGMHIDGIASSRPLKHRKPNWSPRFGLSVDTALTETLQGRWLVKGRATPLHLDAPVFAVRYRCASAETDGKLRELVYAGATCQVENDHYRFSFSGHGSGLRRGGVVLLRDSVDGSRRTAQSG